MKYICLIALSFLSGCATVSEYNQGCQDGIESYSRLNEDRATGGIHDVGKNKEVTKYFCDMLEAKKNRQENQQRGGKAGL